MDTTQQSSTARDVAMQDVLRSASTRTSNGIGYCVGGMAALLVGNFVFGIPCGLLAIHLGSEGIKRGATTFGTVVKLGGWAEIVLTAIGVIATVTAAHGVR